MKFPYNQRFNPPAPTLEVQVVAPFNEQETTVLALLDTGADITVLPRRLIGQLRLRRVDETLVRGISGFATVMPVFSARISVKGFLEPGIYRVIGWEAEYALLGRDLLNRLCILLDGPGYVLEVS